MFSPATGGPALLSAWVYQGDSRDGRFHGKGTLRSVFPLTRAWCDPDITAAELRRTQRLYHEVVTRGRCEVSLEGQWSSDALLAPGAVVQRGIACRDRPKRGAQVSVAGAEPARLCGTTVDGQMHALASGTSWSGCGRFVLGGGWAYEGWFSKCKPHGYGVLSAPDERWEGEWASGCFNDGVRAASAMVPLEQCGP